MACVQGDGIYFQNIPCLHASDPSGSLYFFFPPDITKIGYGVGFAPGYGEGYGLGLGEGEGLGDALGLGDTLGDTDKLGEGLGLGEGDGLTETIGLTLGEGLGEALGEAIKLGDNFPLGLTDLTDIGEALTIYLEALIIGDGLSMSLRNEGDNFDIKLTGTVIATDGLPVAGLTDGDNDHVLHRAGFLVNACTSSSPV